MKIFQLKIKNKIKGFTLIETLVAIFVLTIGIVGAFSLIMSVISFTNYNSNKLIASYLAQEGVELVRNIRDTNWREGEDWGSGINEGLYEIDYDDNSLTNYIDPGNFLKKPDDDFYSYNLVGDSIFKRKINIKDLTDANEISYKKVTVTVEWEEKGDPYDVEVIERLYNWY